MERLAAPNSQRLAATMRYRDFLKPPTALEREVVLLECDFTPAVYKELFGESRTGDMAEISIIDERIEWEFPKERFVTYGPEDEGWCRFFGIGCEVIKRSAITLPNALITHCELTSDGVQVAFRAIPIREMFGGGFATNKRNET